MAILCPGLNNLKCYVMPKLDTLSENKKETRENLYWDASELTHDDRKLLCKKYAPDNETDIACGAPLCPLFRNIGEWFPDEEICSHPDYRNEQCYRNQRKIGQRSQDFSTYFIAVMLDRDLVIKVGIRGLDPDRDPKHQEAEVKKWLAAHPAKKVLSETEREEIRQRFAKGQGKHPDKKTA